MQIHERKVVFLFAVALNQKEKMGFTWNGILVQGLKVGRKVKNNYDIVRALTHQPHSFV